MASEKPNFEINPPPQPQSEEESLSSEQEEESGEEEGSEEESSSEQEEESGEGEESEVSEEKEKPNSPHAKPQSLVNKMPNAQKQAIPPPQSPSESGEEEQEDEEGGDEEQSENSSYSSESDLTVEFNSRMKPTSKNPLQAQNHDEKDLASKKRAKVNADGPMKGERSFVKEDMSLISEAQAKELEVEWKKLRKAEAELLLKKLDLMKEYVSLVLEAMEEM